MACPLSVRTATQNDAGCLARIIRESFHDVAVRFGLTPQNCPTHPSNCEESWIERAFANGITYFVLEENAHPVGCVALERGSNDTCYLERLAVLPDARGKGFGKVLVEHVMAEASHLGFRDVSLAIIADHLELKSWYERFGFVETDTKAFPKLPFRVTFMRKELRGD